jgi:transcriptional regulator with XRE-family HTH domain
MNNLKKMREEKGLSQVELAAKAGVSPNTISLLELGKSEKQNKSTWIALAYALNCSVEELREE